MMGIFFGLHRMRSTSGGSPKFRGLAALGLVLLLSACAEPEPIRIGFLAGISGRVADLGIGGRNGAQLAVEARNQLGGIDGRRLIMVVKDDAQDPEQAKKAIREFSQAGIRVVIGPMTSAMAVAVVPLADELGILLVSPTVTTHELSGKDDNFLRVVSATGDYATRSAEYQLTTTKLRRMAAIHDLRNEAYTLSSFGAFKTRFERGGGVISTLASFTSGEPQGLRKAAEEALASEPEAILLLANSVDAAILTQHVRSLNPKTQVIVSEWGATERFVELAGAAAEGVMAMQFFDRDSQAVSYLNFLAAFRKRYGMEPGFAGVSGHDAATLAIRGLAASPANPKAAMIAGGDLVGLQGAIAIDRFGDAVRRTFVTVVREGKFKALQ